MRRKIQPLCLLVTVAFCCGTGEGPATATSPDRVVQKLTVLKTYGEKLKHIEGSISFSTRDARTEERATTMGDFIFESGKDGVVFYCHFRKRILDGSKVVACDRIVLITEQWLTDSDQIAKVFKKVQLRADGETGSPFDISSGGIPLPFGQDVAKVKESYTVAIEQAEGSSNSKLLLTPKDPKAISYKDVELSLDKDDFPTKVGVTTAAGDTITVAVSDLLINKGEQRIPSIPLPKAGTGWSVSVEPKNK